MSFNKPLLTRGGFFTARVVERHTLQINFFSTRGPSCCAQLRWPQRTRLSSSPAHTAWCRWGLSLSMGPTAHSDAGGPARDAALAIQAEPAAVIAMAASHA